MSVFCSKTNVCSRMLEIQSKRPKFPETRAFGARFFYFSTYSKAFCHLLKILLKTLGGSGGRVVKSNQLPAKITTYLVSIGGLLCLAFLYGWRFLNKISLDWPLIWQLSRLLQTVLTTLGSSVTRSRICPWCGAFVRYGKGGGGLTWPFTLSHTLSKPTFYSPQINFICFQNQRWKPQEIIEHSLAHRICLPCRLKKGPLKLPAFLYHSEAKVSLQRLAGATGAEP